MKRRGKRKKQATFALATWPSEYKPKQKVRVKHHNTTVPAVLIRKKYQPHGAWVCRKKIQGHWTLASVVNELYFERQ